MVEPEPEIWVPVPQAKFVGQTSYTNTTIISSFQWTKLFWSWREKFLDAGTGSKKIRCLELEPEI